MQTARAAIQWNQEGREGAPGAPGPATGPAGGDLEGSYPDPTLRAGSVAPETHAPLPAVRVQQLDSGSITTQAIPSSGGFTNLSFDVELYDTDDMFDPVAPTRITARTSGIYVITGAVRWDANNTGSRSIGLVRNAIGIAFLAADTRDATDGNATRQNVSTVTRLAENDSIELKVSQDSGGDLNVNNNGSPQVHLSVTWLAP
jgi:hypothetical protein